MLFFCHYVDTWISCVCTYECVCMCRIYVCLIFLEFTYANVHISGATSFSPVCGFMFSRVCVCVSPWKREEERERISTIKQISNSTIQTYVRTMLSRVGSYVCTTVIYNRSLNKSADCQRSWKLLQMIVPMTSLLPGPLGSGQPSYTTKTFGKSRCYASLDDRPFSFWSPFDAPSEYWQLNVNSNRCVPSFAVVFTCLGQRVNTREGRVKFYPYRCSSLYVYGCGTPWQQINVCIHTSHIDVTVFNHASVYLYVLATETHKISNCFAQHVDLCQLVFVCMITWINRNKSPDFNVCQT